MKIERLDHVGVVVDDLAAAIDFFTALGLELQGEGHVEGAIVDRIVGLEGIRAQLAMMQTPDRNTRLELTKFDSPPSEDGDAHAAANTLGIRHVAFAVDEIDAVLDRLRAHGGELVGAVERYGGSYRLCYVRGPAGMIVELAERVG